MSSGMLGAAMRAQLLSSVFGGFSDPVFVFLKP
jgi:hypothetical protein